MNDDQLAAFHDLIQFMLWGFVDTSDTSRTGFVNQVKGGTSIASIAAGWAALPAAANWRKLLGELAGLDAPALNVLSANLRAQVAALRSLS